MNTTLHTVIRAAVRCTFVIALLTMPASCIGEDEQTAEQTTLASTGQEAPDFTVEMLDGSRLTLSNLRGGVVLLTFWSPECSMCRAEMAVVQTKVIDRLEDEDFTYLPVSRGLSRETVERFCEDNGYTFPVGLDPDRSIYELYATRYVPRSFLIDRDGTIALTAAECGTDYLDTIVDRARELLRTR